MATIQVLHNGQNNGNHIGRNSNLYLRRVAEKESRKKVYRQDVGGALEIYNGRDINLLVEIACGPGIRTLDLAPHVRKIIAFDSEESMITKANEFLSQSTYRNVTFRTANLENLPLPRRSADAIVNVNYIQYPTQPVPTQTIKESYRIAANGATLVVITVNDESFVQAQNAIIESVGRYSHFYPEFRNLPNGWPLRVVMGINPYSKGQLTKLLEDVGWKTEVAGPFAETDNNRQSYMKKFEVISRTKGFFNRLPQDALEKILDNNLRGELIEERYWVAVGKKK